MTLIDARRPARVMALRSVLESAVAGSTTTLLGSLASASADHYSDIDVSWRVGEAGPKIVNSVADVLRRVAPVESISVRSRSGS